MLRLNFLCCFINALMWSGFCSRFSALSSLDVFIQTSVIALFHLLITVFFSAFAKIY